MRAHELRPPKLLRRLAWFLIRGPDAFNILADLEQLALREVVQGGSRWKASLRYLRNTLASAFSVWTARLSESRWAQMSLLDWKLALRTLLRYPGLTIVAWVSIAFAVMTGPRTSRSSWTPRSRGSRSTRGDVWSRSPTWTGPRTRCSLPLCTTSWRGTSS